MNLPPLSLLRVAGLSLVAYVMMFSYAVARPAVESLFLQEHGSKGLPLAWLLVAVGTLAAVGVYNRYVVRLELLRLFGLASLVSGIALAGLIFAAKLDLPGSYYALYIWKDIYVVILVENFYSFANTVFMIHTARWIYGLLGAISALGSISGNLAIGGLAQRHGTLPSLWLLPFVLLGLGLACLPFSRLAGAAPPPQTPSSPTLQKALPVIRRSSYLILLLLLIAAIQVVITLVDYQFNAVVEVAYPQTDARTAAIGQVYALISFSTMALHLLTGPVLSLLGVPTTLLSIPVLVGLCIAAFVLLPRFETAALLKISSKCFDYSIFRAAKEILYIPLSYAEKTLGKSSIDIATYRLAKGGASLLLMALLAVGAAALITPLNLAMLLVWLLLTRMVVQRFRCKVSRQQELRQIG